MTMTKTKSFFSFCILLLKRLRFRSRLVFRFVCALCERRKTSFDSTFKENKFISKLIKINSELVRVEFGVVLTSSGFHSIAFHCVSSVAFIICLDDQMSIVLAMKEHLLNFDTLVTTSSIFRLLFAHVDEQKRSAESKKRKYDEKKK